MAEKRMFTKKITQSDDFLAMPQSSQNLYWHLNMEADDEGFVNSPKRVMRMVGSQEDDMKLLLTKKFLIGFESGVIVIKHWKMHNLIRSERLKTTSYVNERAQLNVREDGAYTKSNDSVRQMSDKCQPNVNIEEIRLEEIRLEEKSKEPSNTKFGEFKNVILTFDEKAKVDEQGLGQYIERLSTYLEQTGKKYKSHYATILNWSRRDTNEKPNKRNRTELDVVYPTVTTTKISPEEEEQLKKAFEMLES